MLRLRKFFEQLRETPNNEQKTSSVLTAEKLNESERTIWRLVQRKQFVKVYISLDQGNDVLDQSTIAPLVPLMCDGLIRPVQGSVVLLK